MRNNRVTSLPENTFRNLRSNIAVLDLDGNPLECSCNMMWYRSWLQEGDSQFPGPRCGNGKMLRELPLSPTDCDNYERNNQLNMPLTNEHGDMFARQSLDGGPCESEPFEELKSGLPPPEESEYFDQSVDYPATNDTAEPNVYDSPPPSRQPDNSPPSPFNDHRPETGKNFNRSNTLLNLNQPPRPHHPQEQPFSIFGIPIPSFGQLFGQGRQPNGRTTSSRGRGRVQLYRNDDPELLKLLNKNQVQVGVGGSRASSGHQHPNGLQNRPLFQTPFQEPPTVQKGGFKPMLPGEGGFTPSKNATSEETSSDTTIGATNTSQEMDNRSGEERFQEVITVVQTERPRIKVTNKNDHMESSKENLKWEDKDNPKDIELGNPIDIPTTNHNNTFVNDDHHNEPDLDPPAPDATEFTPTDLELDYFDRELEEKRKMDKKTTPDDQKRNELVSALVAPGAQQGIYRTPPGRSTITKVFTPSPGAPPVTTTNAPVVPSPEEYYRSSPHQTYTSTEVLPEPRQSPDWYFESYNKTDSPKVHPKRSYPFVENSAKTLSSTQVVFSTTFALLVLHLLRSM